MKSYATPAKAMTLSALFAAGILLVTAPAFAGPVVFNSFGAHNATIDDSNAPAEITAFVGNDPNYHWNKSNWPTRTGQKAFYITDDFNGLPVSTITTMNWTIDTGYWGNAYFNVMVEDANGKKAILAPSNNSATSTAWGDQGLTKNYAVFEAEAGWTGTPATGFGAATWDEVKDLTITDGPFTEFPDTLAGDAMMQDDPVYTCANWAAWADMFAGGDLNWEKGGVMITFGQSTGTGTPLTKITDIVIEPAEVDSLGACCIGCLNVPYNCQQLTGANCDELGGDYSGDGTTCLVPGADECGPMVPACPSRPSSASSASSEGFRTR